MDEQLRRLIEQSYAMHITHVDPAPRGFVAQTFELHTVERGRVFLKLFPEDRLPEATVGSLPVLAELAARGMNNIVAPLATPAGLAL